MIAGAWAAALGGPEQADDGGERQGETRPQQMSGGGSAPIGARSPRVAREPDRSRTPADSPLPFAHPSLLLLCVSRAHSRKRSRKLCAAIWRMSTRFRLVSGKRPLGLLACARAGGDGGEAAGAQGSKPVQDRRSRRDRGDRDRGWPGGRGRRRAAQERRAPRTTPSTPRRGPRRHDITVQTGDKVTLDVRDRELPQRAVHDTPDPVDSTERRRRSQTSPDVRPTRSPRQAPTRSSATPICGHDRHGHRSRTSPSTTGRRAADAPRPDPHAEPRSRARPPPSASTDTVKPTVSSVKAKALQARRAGAVPALGARDRDRARQAPRLAHGAQVRARPGARRHAHRDAAQQAAASRAATRSSSSARDAYGNRSSLAAKRLRLRALA